MRKAVPFCLLAVSFLAVLAGCNAGQVTEAQQEAKVKAMDDAAKTDPHYAEKHAPRGSGRN